VVFSKKKKHRDHFTFKGKVVSVFN